MDFSRFKSAHFEANRKILLYDYYNNFHKEWRIYIGGSQSNVIIFTDPPKISKLFDIRTDEEIQKFKDWWKR